MCDLWWMRRWNREWGLPPEETREQYISHPVEYTSSRYRQWIITSPRNYHVGGISARSTWWWERDPYFITCTASVIKRPLIPVLKPPYHVNVITVQHHHVFVLRRIISENKHVYQTCFYHYQLPRPRHPQTTWRPTILGKTNHDRTESSRPGTERRLSLHQLQAHQHLPWERLHPPLKVISRCPFWMLTPHSKTPSNHLWILNQ